MASYSSFQRLVESRRGHDPAASMATSTTSTLSPPPPSPPPATSSHPPKRRRRILTRGGPVRVLLLLYGLLSKPTLAAALDCNRLSSMLSANLINITKSDYQAMAGSAWPPAGDQLDPCSDLGACQNATATMFSDCGYNGPADLGMQDAADQIKNLTMAICEQFEAGCSTSGEEGLSIKIAVPVSGISLTATSSSALSALSSSTTQTNRSAQGTAAARSLTAEFEGAVSTTDTAPSSLQTQAAVAAAASSASASAAPADQQSSGFSNHRHNRDRHGAGSKTIIIGALAGSLAGVVVMVLLFVAYKRRWISISCSRQKQKNPQSTKPSLDVERLAISAPLGPAQLGSFGAPLRPAPKPKLMAARELKAAELP